MNKVTGKYSAIVDGKKTGLAGCIGCELNCLRKDKRLEYVLPAFKIPKHWNSVSTISCPRFIPNK